jgi:hypothetical protein
MNQKNIYIALGTLLVAILLATGVWFFFFRSSASVSTTTSATDSSFGGNPVTTGNTAPASTDNSNQTINTTTGAAAQKIFKIVDGPIVGATLIQTLRPTTTLARYIRQDDGHVFDVPLGVAGAVPRVVSNITIPGGQRAIWLEGGNAALVQYVDSSVVKTVYLGFPHAATTTAVLPTRIQFLPDNIIDIAASPDGKSVVYLLKVAGGSNGYIARSDGLNSKKMFSLPLSELLVSWPSQGTILLETKSAAGVTGMTFTADAKSGSVSPLFLAEGLSATADPSFSEVLYEKSNGASQFTYAHNIKNGTDSPLSFNPIPEKCIWSALSALSLYCASPLQYVGAHYLDLWHQGAASAIDSLFFYNLANGANKILVTPGSLDDGVQADILEMALSPDEHYLSYTTKGSRALWGVILAQ